MRTKGRTPHNFRWTLEALQKEAARYDSKIDFRKKSKKAYEVALRRGIVNDICKHMSEARHNWTVEELQQRALKYKTRKMFEVNDRKAYRAAKVKGVFDQICDHMGPANIGPYTLDELQQEALKYTTRVDFQRKSKGSYLSARQQGLLDQVCAHMLKIRHRWTYEELRKEALKYHTRVEFERRSPKAYDRCCKRKIIDQVCLHMAASACTSFDERNLSCMIKEKYPKMQKLKINRVQIADKPHVKGFEIDIYIPELRKGIEFDGKYWHSIQGLQRSRSHWPVEDLQNYHQIKDDYFLSQHGIQILHIKEADWISNRQVCIERCLKFLQTEPREVA
jgi:hypothetical protein